MILYPLTILNMIIAVFQFLCSLTLPVGKLVVSFVEENHKVSSDILSIKS